MLRRSSSFGGSVVSRGPRGGIARVAASLAAATLLGAFAAWPSRAQDAAPPSPSPLRALLKGAGLATDVDPPPDFVVETRPTQPPPAADAFAVPSEPPGKIKSAKELEAMGSDLEAVGRAHDALRAAFPPSAKAVAEAEAAKKAKAKSKPAAASPIPTF